LNILNTKRYYPYFFIPRQINLILRINQDHQPGFFDSPGYFLRPIGTGGNVPGSYPAADTLRFKGITNGFCHVEVPIVLAAFIIGIRNKNLVHHRISPFLAITIHFSSNDIV
jgi:hypothetical protein